MTSISKLALALLCSGLCLGVSGAADPVLVGFTKKVSDGDSFSLQLPSGAVEIRLHGVDAPEFTQPYGKQARAALIALIKGKKVFVSPRAQDDYNRIVARISVDEAEINLQLVRAGHAWAYRHYLTRADTQFCIAEDAARRAGLGLWAQKPWIAPWDWRARDKRPRFRNYNNETLERCIRALGR